MADQGKWFKLWVSALSDAALEDLSIEQWFRWVRLGAYIKAHGTDGLVRLSPPSNALQHVLRVADYSALLDAIKGLPGYVIEESNLVTTGQRHSDVSYTVTSRNWKKYQIDSSASRTRKYRSRKAVGDDPRGEEKRGEEKRKEETPKPPLPSASPKSTANGTPRVYGLQKAFNPIQRKPWEYPEVPEEEQMSPEEMVAIRKSNLQNVPPTAAQGDANDVF